MKTLTSQLLAKLAFTILITVACLWALKLRNFTSPSSEEICVSREGLEKKTDHVLVSKKERSRTTELLLLKSDTPRTNTDVRCTYSSTGHTLTFRASSISLNDWKKGDPIELTINGSHVPISALTIIQSNQTNTILVEAEYVQSNESHIEALLSLGRINLRATTPSKNYPLFPVSEFRHPLRVTNVSEDSNRLSLSVYNESTNEKPELVVDSILINGVELDNLLESPLHLPSDSNDYEHNTRTIHLPNKNLRQGDIIRLTYHLLNPKYPKTAWTCEKKSNRAIEFKFIKNLPFPVGNANNSTYDGFICVYQGGLQIDKPNEQQIARTSSRIKDNESYFPTYLRLSPAYSVQQQNSSIAFADAFIMNTSIYNRGKGEDDVNHLLDELAYAESFSKPFGLAINPEVGSPHCSRDNDWQALAAVSHGASSFVIVSSNHEPRKSTCRDFRIEDLSKIEQTFESLITTNVPVSCNKPGMHSKLLYSNSNELVVVVLNKWCTRKSVQGNHGFYATPRSRIELSVPLPSSWRGVSALDLSGEPVKTQLKNGHLTISPRTFEVGRLLLLRREQESNEMKAAGFDEPLYPKLENVDSPFGKIAPRFPGENITLEPTVCNVSEKPIKISTLTDGKLFRTDQLAPGESRTLTHTVRSPMGGGTHVFRTDIIVDGKIAPELRRFTDVDIVHPWRFDSNHLSLVEGKIATAEIICTDPRFSDYRISGIESEFGEWEIQNGNCIVFKEDDHFAELPLNWQVVVMVKSEKRAPQYLTLQVSTIRNNPIRVVPEKLVCQIVNAESNKTISVRSLTGSPFRIKGVTCSSADLTIDFNSELESDFHTVRVSWPAGRPIPKSSILFDCQLEDLSVRKLSATVQTIGSVNLQAPKQDSAEHNEIDRLKRKVEALVARFENFELASDTPNWIKLHQLLVYRDLNSKPRKAFLAQWLNSPDSSPQIFVVRSGRIDTSRIGQTFDIEHHPHQFLFLLSEANIPLKAKLNADDSAFSVSDLVETAKFNVSLQQGELAWTTAALAHYVPFSSTWKNKYAEDVSVPTLLSKLLNADEEVCGGTHKLKSLCMGIQAYQRCPSVETKRKYNELYLSLSNYVSEEIDKLKKKQSEGGSFGALPLPDADLGVARQGSPIEELHYSGHALECISIGHSNPKEQWVLDSVDYVQRTINLVYPPGKPMNFLDEEECRNYGNLTHAISGLRSWLQRVP